MLSIGVVGHGQGNYYIELAQEDYYQHGGEPPGVWFGQGAEDIGLSGQVTKEAFHNLLCGYAPDGRTPLIQNAGEESHQPGWDLTFSAPKSVSVLWSQADEQTRHAIQEAHFAAVKDALNYLEDAASFTRRGKGGTELEPAHLVVATFEHGTSRAQEPQLHTHALVLNAATREDGTTGTILSKPLYQHKMVTGALYRAELARQIQERLNLDIERKDNLFEVQGVPKALIETCSTRRREIKDALDEKGLTSAKAAAIAALDTRQVKEHVAREILFEQWRGLGVEHGFSEGEVRHLTERQTLLEQNPPADRRDLVGEALSVITQRESYFTERELIRRTAEAAPGRGIGAKRVRAAVQEQLRDNEDIVQLGRWKGEERFTTREMLALEQDLLSSAARLNERSGPTVPARIIEGVIAAQKTLNPEQTEALRHITTNTGGIAVVSGMAGTGKTTLLNSAREAWEQSGYRVLGVALLGKAAQGLQEGALIESRTIAKFEKDLKAGEITLKTFHGKDFHSLQSMLNYAEKVHKPTLTIDSKTVLVVDEAGMIGTRQMQSLVSLVERAGATIRLVGDARQLQPIEAGGPFKAIADRVGTADLREIIRQKDEWARDAVHQFAEGNARDALGSYAERGLLHVANNRRDAMAALIAEWQREGVKRPEQSLIFTGTRVEAAALNRMAQEARQKEGALGDTVLRVGSERFHEGDRVLFTRNSGLYGVKNGTLGTVEHINDGENALRVVLDNKQRTTVSLDNYEHMKLGYAVTTHKGQGVTVDKAYILVGGPMQDRELSYVQASRARIETRIFIDRADAGEHLEDLVRNMQVSHQKELALELRSDRQIEETSYPL